MRIAIIGNSGGGKSTLARRLGSSSGLGVHEVDRFLWQEGWRLAPTAEYEAHHDAAIDGDQWIIEGSGRQDSIARRIERSTHVILIDLPIWQHF